MEDLLVGIESLRRSAAALLSASGLPASHASTLASHLLWFDAMGAPDFGISTLPGRLDALNRGTISAKSIGKVGHERAATAVLDGQNGVGELILDRAGEIAVEKAREVGVGLVRVQGIEPIASAAAVVSGMAIGPIAAIVLGPENRWSVGLTSPDGLALFADSAIGHNNRPPKGFSLWEVALDEGEWIVQAINIDAIEPLSQFHKRINSADVTELEQAGWLDNATLDGHRKVAHDIGVPLRSEVVAALQSWAIRLNVAESTTGS